MWRNGRRLFSTAAVLMILTAALHTIGFASNRNTPDQQVFAATYPELHAIFWTLTFTMSITFAALGAISLVIASSDASDSLMNRVSWVNAVWLVAILILSAAYHVMPPLICAAVIAAVVVVSLWSSRRS
jgi:hypothetical protein